MNGLDVAERWLDQCLSILFLFRRTRYESVHLKLHYERLYTAFQLAQAVLPVHV